MNETERIAYLRGMGYQQYYSRFVLPGAKASPSKPATELPAQPAIGAQQPPPSDSGKQAARPAAVAGSTTTPASTDTARQLFKEGSNHAAVAPARPASTAKVTAVGASAGGDSSAQHSLRFSLQFYRVNDQLAVINEAPHQLRGRDTKEALALLKNILLALGVQEADALANNADGFNWPIAEGLDSLTKPEQAAKLALDGFISQRQEQWGFSNLLLLTAQLADVLNLSAGQEGLGDLNSDELSYQLTVSHSLQSMLTNPDLKRETWAHLQGLRSRLNRD